MRSFQDAFHRAIEKSLDPLEFTVIVFTRQLEKAGYSLDDNQRQHLRTQLIKWGDSDNATFDIPGIDEDLEIDLPEDLDDIIEQMMSSKPNLLNESIDEAEEVMLSNLKSDALEVLEEHKKTKISFENKLASIWAEPLNLLETLLITAIEAGDDVNRVLREDAVKKQDYVFDAVTRLHARSCQIGYEILTLLRAGFADGAHARWRSLHELVVVAYYIRNQGQQIAKRYLLHHVVDKNKAAKLYQEHYSALGVVPFDEEELEEFKQLEKQVMDELALDETGAKYFKKDYGWASTAKRLDPSFVDIAREAGFIHLSPYYKWASHNIHAGPMRFHTSLGLIGIEENPLVAGPSTQGLTTPGHSTAISIMQITTLFLNFENTIDNIALCRVLSTLSNEIAQSFLEVEKLILN